MARRTQQKEAVVKKLLLALLILAGQGLPGLMPSSTGTRRPPAPALLLGWTMSSGVWTRSMNRGSLP